VKIILSAALCLLLAGGGKPVRYAASDDDVPNPERGLCKFVDLVNAKGLHRLRPAGMTLGFALVSLADYRDRPIDPVFLAKMEGGFAAARASGVKIVLRFAYAMKEGEPDAPVKTILGHIAQLKPALGRNADVLAVVQAGFVGTWGEWHSSTHGLDRDPAARREILRALLEAVPASRMVMVRRPRFKREAGPELAARLGHHNDAFFGSETDLGTYEKPVEKAKDWLAQDAAGVVVGGETTPDPHLPDGAAFVRELARMRWSFLHLRYDEDVRAAWEKGGHLDRIRKGLGYRLALVEASFPDSVRPGGVLPLTVKLRNEGFAAIYNPRPLFVILSRGDRRLSARLASVDPRRWQPGASEFSVKLAVPSNLPSGPWRLSLWLPDEAEALRGRPEYAIRLANAGVWDAATGQNVLTEELRIGGPIGATVKEFAEIR